MLLAEYFLQKFAAKYHKTLSFSPGAALVLQENPWLGNVRQLESCIEYAVIMATKSHIEADDLPEEYWHAAVATPASEVPVAELAVPLAPIEEEFGLKKDIQQVEKEKMREALVATQGNKTRAMKLLGISRRTFYKKYKLYGFTD